MQKLWSSNRNIEKWVGNRDSRTEVHQGGEGLTIRENGFKTKTHNLTKEVSKKAMGESVSIYSQAAQIAHGNGEFVSK